MPVSASRARVGMLSQHFSAAELRCPHCHSCPVSPELVELLERIRRHIGRPLPVVSGYRCPIHNLAAGGASNSQHMYGRAADIPGGLIRPEVAFHLGATGVGVEGAAAVHVDVREGPKARWRYG